MVKIIFITLVLLLVTDQAFSQADTINELSGIPGEMPILLKGSSNYHEDILKMLNSDSLKVYDCCDYELIISIIVDKNGKVNEVDLIKGTCTLLFNYIENKIKKLTFYKPAMNFGHPVECILLIRIKSNYYFPKEFN